MDFLIFENHLKIWRSQEVPFENRVQIACWGYLSRQSSHGFVDGFLTRRIDRQTTLLHLKPDPKASCHIRSPRLTLSFASRQASSYQMLLLDVLPKRCNVARDASRFFSLSSKFLCSSLSTVLLAACKQKCSNASLQSGMYGLVGWECAPLPEKSLHTSVEKNRNCSEMGKTRGPNVVMLVLIASPPISTKSLLTFNPLNLSLSSS